LWLRVEELGAVLMLVIFARAVAEVVVLELVLHFVLLREQHIQLL
jgi:hypothetical protein